MIALAPEMPAELRRWAVCGAVAVLAHVGLAAGMIGWREATEAAEPAAAMVIVFAPVAVAPAAMRTELPPGQIGRASCRERVYVLV